jgi:hypothetical protein
VTHATDAIKIAAYITFRVSKVKVSRLFISTTVEAKFKEQSIISKNLLNEYKKL